MTAATTTYDGEHYQVVLMNTRDGRVEGHSQGCKDLFKAGKFDADQDPEGYWDVHTKHEAWIGYNSDFLAEGSGAYPIDWKSCAKHVPQGPADNEETWDQPEAETSTETTTTKKESKPVTTTASTPNVRTYDTASHELVVKALGVDCTIPYCRATTDESCRSAKGKDVEPHTRRVQRALAMEKAAAKKAARAAKPAKKAAKPEPAPEPAPVCKPCTGRHHKQCKGTDEVPCGCTSKAHQS